MSMSARSRLWIGFLAAWLAASLVGTMIVALYVGPSAAGAALGMFLIYTGLWLLLALPFALLRAHRQRLTPRSVYLYAVISSVFAVVIFFALFFYFLMYCLPVAFMVAAMTFHFVALRDSKRAPPVGGTVA